MNKIILAQLSQMIAGFGDRFPDIEGAKGAFKMALSSLANVEIADALVSEAIANFICAKVPNHNNAFPPTPAQLCDEVNRLEKIRIADSYTSIARGSDDAIALEKYRGVPIKVFGFSGTVTVKKSELLAAIKSLATHETKAIE